MKWLDWFLSGGPYFLGGISVTAPPYHCPGSAYDKAAGSQPLELVSCPHIPQTLLESSPTDRAPFTPLGLLSNTPSIGEAPRSIETLTSVCTAMTRVAIGKRKRAYQSKARTGCLTCKYGTPTVVTCYPMIKVDLSSLYLLMDRRVFPNHQFFLSRYYTPG
jgi:hypothetical protein